MTDINTSPDLLVIGGGSGGLSSAQTAADAGASVVLVERAQLGGVCVNRGCVPKKLMWHAARHCRDGALMAQQDLCDPPAMRFATLQERIQAKIGHIRDSYADKLKEAAVQVRRDVARIEDRAARQVRVGNDVYHPGKVLIATGARPQHLDIPGADLAQVSDDVFGWTDIPPRLVIVGGGYVGSEFAAIFNALGSQVHLVIDGACILDGMHPYAADHLQAQMATAGIEIHPKTKPARIDRRDDELIVTLEGGNNLRADRVLIAVGRKPAVDGLGLDGLDLADSGALCVNGRLETSCAGIFAVGDVADRLPLTPVAVRDGRSFARMAFGDGGTLIDLSMVARSAFTLPPVAQVGRFADPAAGTEVSLLKNGVLQDDSVGRAFHHVAVAEGVVTGIALVHDAAPELLGPLAALLGTKATPEDLARATGIHPSFSEEFIGG